MIFRKMEKSFRLPGELFIFRWAMPRIFGAQKCLGRASGGHGSHDPCSASRCFYVYFTLFHVFKS